MLRHQVQSRESILGDFPLTLCIADKYEEDSLEAASFYFECEKLMTVRGNAEILRVRKMCRNNSFVYGKAFTFAFPACCTPSLIEFKTFTPSDNF